MNIEEYRDYCLSKPCVTEHFPFDETTLVFKVCNKIFTLSGLERIPPAINLKCDPKRAIELREANEDAILPGYHMNKKHWNTVEITNLPYDFLIELIDHSYDLVVESLPKKVREELLK